MLCLSDHHSFFMKYSMHLHLSSLISRFPLCRILETRWHSFILLLLFQAGSISVDITFSDNIVCLPFISCFSPVEQRLIHRYFLHNLISIFSFCWDDGRHLWVTHLIPSYRLLCNGIFWRFDLPLVLAKDNYNLSFFRVHFLGSIYFNVFCNIDDNFSIKHLFHPCLSILLSVYLFFPAFY